MSDYRPISCEQHSEFELAIVQHRLLTLQWQDADGQTHLARVKPTDIFTRNHEEFLRVEMDSQQTDIRLDRIMKANPG